MKNSLVLCALSALALAACQSRGGGWRDDGWDDRGAVRDAVPTDQSLRRGETRKVSIPLRRDLLRGPVRVRVDNLPAGVEVVEKDLRFNTSADDATFTLYAHPDADLVAGHAVRVTATASDDVSDTQWLKLAVRDR